MKHTIISVKSCLTIAALFLLQFHTNAQSLDRAYDLIDQGKYKEAAMQLRPLADGGDAEAQYVAATLFLEGKGVPRNPQQAFKYAKMAADQTSATPISILLTSWMYYEGIGTKADTDLALTYARKLKEGELRFAAIKLLGGKSYSFDEKPEPFPTKNEALAFLYFELLSQTQDRNLYQDKIEALARLSRMCYEGIGTKQDTAQTLRYAKMIYNDSRNYFYSDKAYYQLVCYFKKQSDTMYFRSLRANDELETDIATQRSEGIQMKEELIQCYLNGTGCSKNPSEALRLINNDKNIRKQYLDASSSKLDIYIGAVLSAGNGKSLAHICDITNNEDLLEALLKKYSIEHDADKLQKVFQEWLRQAEEGSPSAMWMVSNFYENGTGVSADMAKSRQWAQKAVDKGKNTGIWWARNEYMKNKPYVTGEIVGDNYAIVVESEKTTSTYTSKKGKTTKETYFRGYEFEIAIKEYTANEIKEGFKNRELKTYEMPEYKLDAHFKVYAETKKRMGQPIPEGKYWAKKSWRDKDAWLLDVNADGVITGRTSLKELSKKEMNQPHYFVAEHFWSSH